MGARECPGAQLRIQSHGAETHCGDGRRVLPVAQLADVEVAAAAASPAPGPVPAEEDIAGRLHETLTCDHPLTLAGILAGPRVPASRSRDSLLHLQEEPVGRIGAEQQDYPAAQATLPIPTTWRAMSATWKRLSRNRRSDCKVRW